MSAQIQALRQYYDVNTARFLRWGGSGGSRPFTAAGAIWLCMDWPP